MRKAEMRPVPRAEPTGGRLGDHSGGKDGFLEKDFELPFAEGPSGGMLSVNPSVFSDKRQYKFLLHLGTWVLAIIFAIMAYAITRAKYAVMAGDEAMELAGWFVMVHSVAFFFLLAGVVCVVLAGATWQKPYLRPMIMAGANGLVLASLPLYTALIPTAATWYEAAASDANLTVPGGGDVFSGDNAEDMAKLRDFQLVVVVLQAFGIAQVAAYTLYTLSLK